METPKKKHLIELMIEAGVKWPDGAEYAAQDKRNMRVNFYRNGKPNMPKGEDEWLFNHCNFMGSGGLVLPSLCRNWHQTIVTREQYAEAVADADGSKTNRASESEHIQDSQPAAQYCASVMRQMPDNTIEQLTADYHAKAAEADRTQSVADEALKAADDALLALEKAGELLGLVISIDTKPKQVDQPAQPEITDWRDLRAGDVIECIEPLGGSIQSGDTGIITKIHGDMFLSDFKKQRGYAYKREHLGVKFRFIRRP